MVWGPASRPREDSSERRFTTISTVSSQTLVGELHISGPFGPMVRRSSCDGSRSIRRSLGIRRSSDMAVSSVSGCFLGWRRACGRLSIAEGTKAV